MKSLIALLVLYSISAKAYNSCVTSTEQEQIEEVQITTTDVPSHLKGATIIVRLADGKESAVPAELFKVVPRKQERNITKVSVKTTEVCKELSLEKNRASLMVGRGVREGFNRKLTSDGLEVSTKTGAVEGFQYQRLLDESISIGIQIQSNQTTLVSVGLDF